MLNVLKMSDFLQETPLLLACLISALIIYIAFEIGFRISQKLLKQGKMDNTHGLGHISAGIVGMLAFVLAFTFSMASGHNDLRKKMVLEEANAIGTAYLRADLLEEDSSIKMKRLLSEYVDIRVEAAAIKKKIPEMLVKSVEIHRKLWQLTRAEAQSNPNTNTSLIIQSVNDVIDMHEKRVSAGLRYRIPLSVWITLYSISIMAMIAIGVETGLGKSRRLVVIIPLVLAFTALTTLIIALNRPQNGMIKVGQESMISLQESFEKDMK
jgi:hypothetical protein